MRVRITDGTNQVEIRAKGYSRGRLDDIEHAALRMLDALRDSATPADTTTRFGFTPDRTLEGVSLDSVTERAEPIDGHRDDGEGDEE